MPCNNSGDDIPPGEALPENPPDDPHDPGGTPPPGTDPEDPEPENPPDDPVPPDPPDDPHEEEPDPEEPPPEDPGEDPHDPEEPEEPPVDPEDPEDPHEDPEDPEENLKPDTPTVLVSDVTPTSAKITGSAFSDPNTSEEPNTHVYSQFRVRKGEVIHYDSGQLAATLEHTAAGLPDLTTGLIPGVRYSDGVLWSEWGEITSFATPELSKKPNAPVVFATTGIGPTFATVNSSPFSDPNVAPEYSTHLYSQFQLRSPAGAVLEDSGQIGPVDTFNFTGLDEFTDYVPFVRKSDGLLWSDYGEGDEFSTTEVNVKPNTPVVGTTTGITSTGATINSDAFSDPNQSPALNQHVYSQFRLKNNLGNVVWDSGQISPVDSRQAAGLTMATTYVPEVRKSDGFLWSSWGVGASFQTAIVVGPGEPEWDVVVENTTITGNYTVPPGEKHLFKGVVRIKNGNLIVDGAVHGMRPGSTLLFNNPGSGDFIGGGLHFDPSFQHDYGIWIGHHGVPDWKGTAKKGWNRTGSDPSWKSGDEYWITPTDFEDFDPRSWTPGQAIPRAHNRVPTAEVANATRDVVFRVESGAAHIHLHPHTPVNIEYVRIDGFGVWNAPGDGRYSLHLHHGGEALRGSVVKGVVVINAKGRGFVPHLVNGTRFLDCVYLNGYSEGFWWDDGEDNMSNDTFVDSLLSAGVNLPPEISGSPSRVKAITLNFGTGNIIRNSVACGSKGSKLSVGFDWPPGHRPPAVWEFDVGNVAHNNQGPGLRFWNNSKKLHVVTNYIAYRNGGGIENGAYSNTNRYADCLLIDEGYDKQTGISPAWQHHSSSARREDDGGPGRYQRVEAHAHNGAGLEIKGLNLPSETRWEYLQCKFNPSSGRPVVDYQGSGKGNPWIALFKDCDNLRAGRKLNPSDFEWNKINNGTSVYIQTGSSIIEVYHENGQVKQRTLS